MGYLQKSKKNNLLDYNFILKSFVCVHWFIFASAFSVFGQQNNLPEDFPKMRDTGNKDSDAKTYAKEKEEWIQQSPKEYQSIGGKLPNEVAIEKTEVLTNAPSIPTIAAPTTDEPLPLNRSGVTQTATPIIPPHYPIARNTGNIAADAEADIQAKMKWIQQYPEEYKEMGGNPEEIKGDITTVNSTMETIPTNSLTKFNAVKRYYLEFAEALPLKTEIAPFKTSQETQLLKEDFPERTTLLEFGENNSIRLSGQLIDFRAVEKKSGLEVEWYNENTECLTCSKTLYLTIESELANQITYLLKSEDENADFIYRLTFQLY